MDFILDFFSSNFYNCVWLAVILIAICPTLESKIAIPFAMNTAIWGTHALTPFAAFILSFLGSLLPVTQLCLLYVRLSLRHLDLLLIKF